MTPRGIRPIVRATFIDGNPEGCKCGMECEFPCWQRVGLTSEPCCPDCRPLEDVDDE